MSTQTEQEFESEEELLSSVALPGIYQAPQKGRRNMWMRQGEFIAAYGGQTGNGNVSAEAVENYDLSQYGEIHITHTGYSRDGNASPSVGDANFYAIFGEQGDLGREGASLSQGGPRDLQFSASGHMRKLGVDRPARFEVLGYAVKGKSKDTDEERVILRLKLVQSGTEGMDLEA